jgi:hypothetical protein
VTIAVDEIAPGEPGTRIAATRLASPRVLPRIRGMDETIVLLAMIAQLFFAVPALKLAQSGTEMVLFALLIYACMTIRFSVPEAALLALLGIMTVVSMFINDLSVLLVGVKQFGLGTLCLVYFSRVRFRSRLILPAFIVSVLMILISRIAPSAVAPLIAISRSPEFNESRFGGLFLNAHYNAYFLAVALIYYGYRVRMFGLGQVLIFLTGSKFVFVSYATNVAARYPIVRFFSRHRRIVLLFLLAVVAVLWNRRFEMVAWFDTTAWMSAYVILSQLFDPQFYSLVLNPLPGDYLAIVNGLKGTYGAVQYTNEIGLFAMCIQGGLFLTVAYLAALLKHARPYRIFILVSLLHYGFVLSPLIVYMIVTYSREIRLIPHPNRPALPPATPVARAS